MAIFDQSGTFRPLVRQWLGPSLGWTEQPAAILRVTTSTGTTVVDPGVVNVNAPVTLQLPKFALPPALAPSLPKLVRPTPLTIIDQGGFAAANHITILAASGETISGSFSVQITAAYGAMMLQPDSAGGDA